MLKILIVRKIVFLENLSASCPPKGDMNNTKKVGIAANNPTIKVEFVFSSTYQLIK